MKEKIKISIVVPVYNLKKELTRCVKCVLEQTYRNLEILLVDDGSTDGSKELIQELSKLDKRIIAIYKENGGVTSARLAGVKIASGEYIGFVDGDDEIESDMYEFLLSNAVKYHADISHCGYQMVFADGRVHYFYNTGRIVKQDKTTGLQNLLEGSFVEPGVCNKLFHKKLFQKLLQNELLDESIKINEDLMMNFHLFSAAEQSVFQDECKYHYIVRENSASRSKLNKHKIYDPIKVRAEILRYSYPKIEPWAQKAYVSTCIDVYNSLVLARNADYKSDMEKVYILLKQNEAGNTWLSKKRKIMVNLILKFPVLYGFVYRFYAKHLQKKIYE